MRVPKHVDGINRRFLWLVAVAVVIGVAAWYVIHCGPSRPEAVYGQVPAAGDGSMVIYMSHLEENRVAICLVNIAKHRLAVYQVDFGRQRMKLIAVRDFAADFGLSDYNNEAPLPKDIRAWLEGKKGG